MLILALNGNYATWYSDSPPVATNARWIHRWFISSCWNLAGLCGVWPSPQQAHWHFQCPSCMLSKLKTPHVYVQLSVKVHSKSATRLLYINQIDFKIVGYNFQSILQLWSLDVWPNSNK